MVKRKIWLAIFLCVTFTLCFAASGFCWGKKELETEESAVKLLREVERGGYKIVTTDQLKAWMDDNKDMIIVDTMPYEASYKKSHLEGAVQFLFPIPDMNTWDAGETAEKTKEDYEKLLGPDKDKTIVVYCGFVKCTRSHNGAAWAKKLGYSNVYRYPGGIKAWQEAKYPTEKVK